MRRVRAAELQPFEAVVAVADDGLPGGFLPDPASHTGDLCDLTKCDKIVHDLFIDISTLGLTVLKLVL